MKNKKNKTENQTPKIKKKELSKKEIKLRQQFDTLAKLLKKHNVKPFDRKEIYGTY